LYYYYQRFYDPSIGRFISPDLKLGTLSNPESLNLYIYVLDRPTSLTDPSGLDWWNPWSWTPQQQAQAFTIAVIVVAVVAVVATGGVASPLAAAAVGAALSTTAYTVTQGDKATLTGAVTMAAVGAVLGGVGAVAAGGSAAGGIANIAGRALVNGAISGGVNTGVYSATAVFSGQSITAAGLAGAFVSGFVSGALGTKGVLAPAAGSTLTRWVASNVVSGEASYIAGQYAQGKAPTATGMWEQVPYALAGGLASDSVSGALRGMTFGSVVGATNYVVNAVFPVMGIWDTQGPIY